MNFQNAIMSGFKNYANFKGRASRSAYWYWSLFSIVLQLALSSVGGLGTVVSAGLLLPSLSIGCRRMHDTGRRGWWLLIPFAGLIFACQASHQNENQFGPPPPPGA